MTIQMLKMKVNQDYYYREKVYKFVYFIERVLFKLEKRKQRVKKEQVYL